MSKTEYWLPTLRSEPRNFKLIPGRKAIQRFARTVQSGKAAVHRDSDPAELRVARGGTWRPQEHPSGSPRTVQSRCFRRWNSRKDSPIRDAESPLPNRDGHQVLSAFENSLGSGLRPGPYAFQTARSVCEALAVPFADTSEQSLMLGLSPHSGSPVQPAHQPCQHALILGQHTIKNYNVASRLCDAHHLRKRLLCGRIQKMMQ